VPYVKTSSNLTKIWNIRTFVRNSRNPLNPSSKYLYSGPFCTYLRGHARKDGQNRRQNISHGLMCWHVYLAISNSCLYFNISLDVDHTLGFRWFLIIFQWTASTARSLDQDMVFMHSHVHCKNLPTAIVFYNLKKLILTKTGQQCTSNIAFSELYQIVWRIVSR